MKPALSTRFLYLSLCSLLLSWCGLAWSAPVVSNISASQQTGTKQVKITYDVAAPGFTVVDISLEVSADGGATWNVPVTAVKGAIGAGVSVGTGKTITWDAGADWPGRYSTQMRFRVIADDGVVPVPPIVFSHIPSGSFTMGRIAEDEDLDAFPHTVTVSSFYMAQTLTTWGSGRKCGLGLRHTATATSLLGQGKPQTIRCRA